MRAIAAILFVFVISGVVVAQSGRRIKVKPTPKPVVVAADEYSESRSKPRRLYPRNYKPKTEAVTAVKTEKAPELDENGDEVISVDSTLVTIPVSVFDRNGLYVRNIMQQEVKVFDQGVEQEIAFFGKLEKPFTVALLIDTSPSTAYKIKEIRSAAKTFVSELRSQDSVLVIEFDNNPQVLTEVTKNRQKIYDAIDRADFGNGTALYDAVDLALNKRLNKIKGRKAIVLFTDGVDTASRRSYISTITDAEENDTIIYPIYYNTYLSQIGGANAGINGGIIPRSRNRGYGNSAEEYARGKVYLEELAGSTGGRVFRPESTPGGLTNAFRAIAEELGRQYSLGYYPADEGSDGQRRSVKVRVYRPKLIIHSRDSYIVGSQSGGN
jgi:VWFA-related protein